jgi:SAM-dependent methyltransferase
MITRRVFPNKASLIKAVVSKTDDVLDLGFLGQGIRENSPHWPHTIIKKTARGVSGVDLAIDRRSFPDTFSFPGHTFDVLFAGDLIEHLPNAGLFLDACARHMSADSRLVLTTPNCFNLFNLAEKLTKDEPTVNADHTCYFNRKTLTVLLQKCNFEVEEFAYVYSLEYAHTESWKKKFLNGIYRILSWFTPKFLETLVVIARPAGTASK